MTSPLTIQSSPKVSKAAFLSTTKRRVSNQGNPIKTSVISSPPTTGITPLDMKRI